MTLPTAWSTFAEGLRAWVVAATGLPDASVVFGDGGGPRPAAPCVVLRLTDGRRRGRDWIAVEDNPVPDMGDEVYLRARGARTFTLSLQAFAASPAGSSSAVGILHAAVAALALPSIKDGLRVAGAGIGPVGTIQNVGAGMNWTRFEPRAALEVQVHAASEVSETGTYIESVELENLATGLSTFVPDDGEVVP